MAAGQVSSVQNSLHRPAPVPAQPKTSADADAESESAPAEPHHHWHLSDLLHVFHRKAS